MVGTERSSRWHTSVSGESAEPMFKSHGGREAQPQSQTRRNSGSGSSENSRKEAGTKRGAHNDAEFPALGELSDQVYMLLLLQQHSYGVN